MEDVTYSRFFLPRVKPFCATIRHTLTFFLLCKNVVCGSTVNSVWVFWSNTLAVWNGDGKMGISKLHHFFQTSIVIACVWICFSSTPEKSAHFQIMNGGEELDDCCRLHIRKIWEKVFGTLSLLLNDELTCSVANSIAEFKILQIH